MQPPTPSAALTPQEARALLRSLRRGTGTASGAPHIHVGHSQWLAAQSQLLAEIAEDGHSDTKFVRGAYGSGKSHFLSVVQAYARQVGWMTAHVECKVDGVQIDRFETVYPKIAAKLRASNTGDSELFDSLDAGFDPVRSLLDQWVSRVLEQAGIKGDYTARPLDADNRLLAELQRGLLRSSLPPDFTRALVSYSRAVIARDAETQQAVCLWLRGTAERQRLPGSYLSTRVGAGASVPAAIDLRPIGKGSVTEVMRGFLWLVRAAGYRGLVLCIDEVEELARLGTRKRQDQALQALREYVDNAGGHSGYRFMLMYLAATPEMFEGEAYFPRYDALATRIQPVGAALNWRAPVIDLDRTPLSGSELRDLGRRLWMIYRLATGADTTMTSIDAIVGAVMANRSRIAKPRLLTRILLEEFDKLVELGSSYSPPDATQLSASAAAALSSETER